MSTPSTTPPKRSYAYLPEDLLLQMLEQAPETAQQLANSVELNDSQLEIARNSLMDEGLIQECSPGDHAFSIMAADGANIIEHKTSADILLSLAVGVDGLGKDVSKEWAPSGRQYQQWQAALPHHVANPRLAQGIMFLMELSVLAEADREIRIMDGSHLTTILKLNSLLSAKDNENADMPYVNALRNFLYKNYEKIIPDIPDIITKAFSDDSIIGLTKYSSSREIIDSRLTALEIKADDKIFMSSLLKQGEYTTPLPVGQSPKDHEMWRQIHLFCNLDLGEEDNIKDELNNQLRNAIAPFRVSEKHESELFFCYYKPFENTPALRVEMKKPLAEQVCRTERYLRSIKQQIVFPEIREPYPQFLADIIAKNISFGMQAVDQAICNDPRLNEQNNFDLIFPYRTK